MKNEPLLELIHTKKDQAQMIDQFEQLYQSLFNLKESLDEKLDVIFSGKTRLVVKELLKENKLDLDNPMTLQKTITDIKNQLLALPVATLEVAVEPTETMLNAVHTWFLVSLPNKYILDIQVNPKLLGAACITVNGRYKDYSLRKKLQEFDMLNGAHPTK